MSGHPDPRPAAGRVASDLLDHIGAARAFTAAARKKPLADAPSGDAANLDAAWRTVIRRQVRALGEAWQDPEAWAA